MGIPCQPGSHWKSSSVSAWVCGVALTFTFKSNSFCTSARLRSSAIHRWIVDVLLYNWKIQLLIWVTLQQISFQMAIVLNCVYVYIYCIYIYYILYIYIYILYYILYYIYIIYIYIILYIILYIYYIYIIYILYIYICIYQTVYAIFIHFHYTYPNYPNCSTPPAEDGPFLRPGHCLHVVLADGLSLQGFMCFLLSNILTPII